MNIAIYELTIYTYPSSLSYLTMLPSETKNGCTYLCVLSVVYEMNMRICGQTYLEIT
jgi:hypothetical protein